MDAKIPKNISRIPYKPFSKKNSSKFVAAVIFSRQSYTNTKQTPECHVQAPL